MPPTALDPRLPVRHRLAGARRRSGQGVRLADLLDRAGVQAARRRRRGSRRFDGAYTESLTLEPGAPRRRDRRLPSSRASRLSAEHGGPVRLYVAPMYGYKSCKWLDAHRAHRRRSSPATGSTAATTSTDGSAGRTAATTTPPDAGTARSRAERTGRSRASTAASGSLHWVNAHAVRRPDAHRRRSSTSGPLVRRWSATASSSRTIHVYCGLALPVPLLVASSAALGRALRTDLGRLNRWIPRRRAVVPRRRPRRARFGSASSTPGQKLNAAFIVGAALVMLGHRARS